MGKIDQCNNCGQKLTPVALSDEAVAVDGCQKCSPGHVKVHYDAIPNREDSGDNTRKRNNQPSSSLREKITKMNVKKIDDNDKIELKKNDGSSVEIVVTDHKKKQEEIEGRERVNERSVNLTYENVIKSGCIIFDYPEQQKKWDTRPDIPWDFPMSDSKNEKILLETSKREYVKTINFIKTSMQDISDALTRAVEVGANFLIKAPLEVAVSPFITAYYIAWGHGSLKEKLAAGEITPTEYEEQCEWYRGYFGKAAIAGGCVVGGVAALGAKWYLSNCVRAILVKQLTIVWAHITPHSFQIGIYVQKTIAILEAKTAVGGLKLLCQIFPRLGQIVGFVGGPQVFLAIGAAILIIGGGLLAWYLHKKWANRKALEKLVTEFEIDVDKKGK